MSDIRIPYRQSRGHGFVSPAVNSLCTVNTVHGLRDCRKDGKPIQCPILLTFS